MTVAGVRPGDIVQCDIKGDRFYALVGDRPTKGELEVHPISSGRGKVRIVTARQVVGHWRKRKARAA